jgi:hypothetical protein
MRNVPRKIFVFFKNQSPRRAFIVQISEYRFLTAYAVNKRGCENEKNLPLMW